MTKIIRIDPDGTITDIEGEDLLAPAHALFATVDVVTCRAPFYEGYLVGAVDDWGRHKNLALNVKAWAVYGRSPIFGPMLLARDQDDDGHRDPLDETLVALLRRDPIDFIQPATFASMDRILREEGIR